MTNVDRSRLVQILEEGRRAYPEVRVDDAQLEQRLAPRLEMAGKPSRSGGNEKDLFLVAACQAGDRRALRILEERILPQVALAFRRIDPTPEFAQEVAQALREKLLVPGATSALAAYSGAAPLLTWMRASALKIALNVKRKGRREIPMGDEVAVDLPFLGETAELRLMKRELKGELTRAFRQAVRDLTREERNALRLHFIEGLSLEELGAHFNVHRATAARWIARARVKVLEQTRNALAPLVSQGRLTSLLQLVRTGFDSSIRRALESKDEGTAS